MPLTTPNQSAQDISSNKTSTPKKLTKKLPTIILLNAQSRENTIELFNWLLKDAKPSIAFVLSLLSKEISLENHVAAADSCSFVYSNIQSNI
jgi:hypothetical protein